MGLGWGRTLPDRWRGVLRRDGFHVPSSCNSAHVDRPPRERGFSGATGSPFHITPPAASPAWGLPKTPPRGRSEARTPRRAGRSAASLRSLPRPRRPASRGPGTKPATAPRSPHAPDRGPGSRRHRSRAPRRVFSVGPELGGCRPLPPLRPSPWDLPRVSGSPHGGRGGAHAAPARAGAPQRAEGRGSPPPPRGPTRRPPRAARRLAATASSSCGHPRPGPEAPGGGPSRGLPASRAVPGLAGSAAHGAGSGGGNVNKSGFYSYLTLECRVHLLSARYQTPAAPSRVFTKAACASSVAEPSARAAALRRRRTRPAPAPCAAAPGPPERYAGGAPAAPSHSLRGRSWRRGKPRHPRELHRQAELKKFDLRRLRSSRAPR